jgi:hypothetical protein
LLSVARRDRSRRKEPPARLNRGFDHPNTRRLLEEEAAMSEVVTLTLLEGRHEIRKLTFHNRTIGVGGPAAHR